MIQLLERVLKIGSDSITFFDACKVHKVRRSVYFMIEVFRITQHKFILHIGVMSHT